MAKRKKFSRRLEQQAAALKLTVAEEVEKFFARHPELRMYGEARKRVNATLTELDPAMRERIMSRFDSVPYFEAYEELEALARAQQRKAAKQGGRNKRKNTPDLLQKFCAYKRLNPESTYTEAARKLDVSTDTLLRARRSCAKK